MTERRLRIFICFYLILLQTGLIGLSTYYLADGGFLFTQYTTLLGLILPLFTGYLSLILKFFASQKYSDAALPAERNISPSFAILSFTFPTLLGIAVALCIYSSAHGIIFRNFEDVKIAISLGQAAFGIYIGQFIYSLFEGATPASRARSAKPSLRSD